MITVPSNAELLDGSVARIRNLTETDPQLRAALPSADALQTLEACRSSVEMLAKACELYASRPALGMRADDANPGFTMTTYGELWTRTARLATALARHEWVKSGDRVGICAAGSTDYVVAHNACMYLSATFVPLALGGENLKQIANDAELCCILCDVDALGMVLAALPECPTVQSVVVMRSRAPHASAIAEARERLRARVRTLEELEAAADGPPEPMAIPAKDANPLRALLYTSGSTGLPKGAMLPESVWYRQWLPSAANPFPFRQPSVPLISVSFLPLNHLAGLGLVHQTLTFGGTLYFTLKSDMSTLFDDIRTARPTHLDLVPRLLDTIHQHYQHEIARGVSHERALEVMQHGQLGDRLVGAMCSGAPLAPELHAFARECFRVPFFDRWGMTETGPISFENKIFRENIIDYKLVELPGFDNEADGSKQGELCVKARRATTGYFKNEEATKNLFDEDGYLKTGDIAAQRGQDILVWVGRRNDVFKLSQGEFVTIWRLEDVFVRGSSVIRQIYLYGNSRRPYLLAVVVPHDDALADSPDAKRILQAEINRIAKVHQLRPYEIPRDFIVERAPFSKENGLVTHTGKISRARLKTQYGDPLERLYAALEATQIEGLGKLRKGHGVPIGEVLQVSLGVTRVGLGQTFVELGGDSLDAVRFAALVEELWAVAMPVAFVLGRGTTVQLMSTFVEDALAGKRARDVTFEKIHGVGATVVRSEDLRLEKFVRAAELSSERRPTTSGESAAPKVVLLTGANGFLGRFLLLDLVEEAVARGGKVLAMVRAESSADAHKRIVEVLGDPTSAARLESLEADGRLTFVAGDLMLPRLGLGEAAFDQLADEVDTILHAGALVNHAFSYPQLFESNVLGSLEIMRLATRRRTKSVSFVSTVGFVGGLQRSTPVLEDEDARALWKELPVDGGTAAGYSASKWATEVMLGELHERFGVPVNILRCTAILAHASRAGQLNAADFFTRFLCGVVWSQIAPRSLYASHATHNHFDGLPVDFVARSIAGISMQPSSALAIYHVANAHWSDGISLDTVVDWVRSAGYRVAVVDDYARWYTDFATKLKSVDGPRRKASPLPIIQRWERPLSGGQVRLDAARFAEASRNLPGRLEIPHITEAFIHKCLADMRALGLIDGPGS
jgi:fatty acid CoA ligase FadD9